MPIKKLNKVPTEYAMKIADGLLHSPCYAMSMNENARPHHLDNSKELKKWFHDLFP
jgi:hypothetical protein